MDIISTTKKLCPFLVIFSLISLSIATSDTIFSGQSLSGNKTLTSKGRVFELGFFKPGQSLNHYYIGIWYIKPGNRTVVWVANRNSPVSDPSLSAFKLSKIGNLTLLGKHSNNTVWSNTPRSTASKATTVIGVLLDSGNFVVRDRSNPSVVIWQSFDHPTDTWLPGGKIGYNKLTGERLSLIPWKHRQDPSPGIFTAEVDPNSTSHLLVWNGSVTYWTSGDWTGTVFSLVTEILLDQYVTNITYVVNKEERYFTYEATQVDYLTRFVTDSTGQLKQYVWGQNYSGWSPYWMRPSEQCEVYGFCGSFSECNRRNTPICECMVGFEPRVREDWDSGDHSGGCVRKTPLECDDAFVEIAGVQIPPDSGEKLIFERGGDERCRSACSGNCSCEAYSYSGGRCSIWRGGKELMNVNRILPDEEAKDHLYLRISASEVKESGGPKKNLHWVIIVAILVALCSFLAVALLYLRMRFFPGVSDTIEGSLVVFGYRDLKSATKNFSEKLGEGGFGVVYKGTLSNSNPANIVAVKKLKSLRPGEKQFRAEVNTIGVVQHVNLVRLRGFCAESSKRFLVYDFMPKGSLESVLFQNNPELDWGVRYRIAIGTARGLSYLHEECRDCIIHCDIKPENVLLDSEYNPKLADFGLAKLVGRDFSRVLTTMRGTIGYLAPEWISGEAITPKADVFSYGMLLFEIITGRRNGEFLDRGMEHYFPYQIANSLREEEDVTNWVDHRLNNKLGDAEREEVVRACKVACWCIQDNEKSRPSMSLVIQILTGLVEVSVAPVPLFIQRLVGQPVEAETVDSGREKSSSDSTLVTSEDDVSSTEYFPAE